MAELNQERVLAALHKVQDPALEENIVAANLVRDVAVNGVSVSLKLALVAPLHPHVDEIKTAIEAAIREIDADAQVEIETVLDVPNDGRNRTGGVAEVRNIIAVASGKGGVGKSTVAVNLAVALAQAGARVGLLDADVYGPNVPTMMGAEHKPPEMSSQNKMTPVESYGVKLMSIGFLVDPNQPLIWRGPMLHSAVRQFTQDVAWGVLDYLVIDLPPGTGDVQLSLAQTSTLSGSLIVTMPQNVSLEDARRGLYMFEKLEIPVFGVVENMSYLELADGQKMDVFGGGGGERLAQETGAAYIGGIPIDPAVREGGDSGNPIVVAQPDSAVAKALVEIAQKVAMLTSKAALEQRTQEVKISFN
ncbi:MAG: Mrp/NBP35 family ATP-binding protein [Anaerolineales bacterium]|nr:Mrp/NBP35 family ATP-binding protein [Anaerolineales bacterium]